MPLLTLQELETMSPLFRGRAGRRLGCSLMRRLSVDKLNALYDRHAHLSGPDFAHSVLADLGIEYDVIAQTTDVMSQLDMLSSGAPFITISNHPYGSIDGIILADLFGHLHPDYKIMVNKILGRIEALSPSFISVTPTGVERTTPTKESIVGVRRALGQPLGCRERPQRARPLRARPGVAASHHPAHRQSTSPHTPCTLFQRQLAAILSARPHRLARTPVASPGRAVQQGRTSGTDRHRPRSQRSGAAAIPCHTQHRGVWAMAAREGIRHDPTRLYKIRRMLSIEHPPYPYRACLEAILDTKSEVHEVRSKARKHIECRTIVERYGQGEIDRKLIFQANNTLCTQTEVATGQT